MLRKKMNKKSVIMSLEELKILIESAGVTKGILQRALAKLTGISSRSTLNVLINGKIKKSELELLDFEIQKRNKVSDVRQKIFYIMEHLQIMKDNKDSLYTIDKAIEDIKYAFEKLNDVEQKYDYNKLPERNLKKYEGVKI